MTRTGLMLYTVREECARDLLGSLGRVAELGFEGVELHDLFGHDPGAVRRRLDELGLAVAGRHAGLDALRTRLPELADELRVLGSDRLVLSWIDPPGSEAEAAAAVAAIADAARRAAAAGLRFGFHNHWAELRAFAGGSVLDRLLALPDAPLFFELDLGWAWEAGADPVELLGRARGRSPLVHVKDLAGRGTRAFRPVGDGAVGYERVVPAAVSAGVDWLLVEQDETDGDPLAAAARSLAFVRSLVEVPA